MEERRVKGCFLLFWFFYVEEREERGREVPAKWVGLVGPIEAVGSSGVVVETVLGLVVVFEHMGEFVFVHVLMLLMMMLLLLLV